MRIIPVLDVMNGAVVRAVGGRRSEYRPVVSRLTDSTEPLAVAKALLAVTGASELYVADLDAILKARPHPPAPSPMWRGGVQEGDQTGMPFSQPAGVMESQLRPAVEHPLSTLERGPGGEVSSLITHLPATIWLDIGLHDALDADQLKHFRNVRPIIASETFAGAASHDDVLRLRPAMSIDLRNGELLSASTDITSPLELAERMHAEGYRTFLLLDLARVGMNAGPGTEPLCGELRRRKPGVELLVGGGVRNRDDMRRLEDAGADGVLVASALHDGTLP